MSLSGDLFKTLQGGDVEVVLSGHAALEPFKAVRDYRDPDRAVGGLEMLFVERLEGAARAISR